MTDDATLSPSDKATFLRVLDQLRGLDPNSAEYIEMEHAVAHVVKSAKKRRQLARRHQRRQSDQALDEQTSTFEQPIIPDVEARAGDSPGERSNPRHCYVCKEPYRLLDAHYHLLCPSCAERNAAERVSTIDLTGRNAVVTGGRIKIGFHVALRLLRAGANVIVSTRFPVDAQHRFAAVEDAPMWIDRLSIVGADFLHGSDVDGLVSAIQSRFDHLDILINNAAQTIARPTAYYRGVIDGEQREPPELSVRVLHTAAESRPAALTHSVAEMSNFLPGLTDETGEQLDTREQNSWGLALHEIDPSEWVSCHIVSTFVPWLLIRSLREMMLASPNQDRFVINVSAMEGAFTMANKTSKHAHTNAAKAGLNMITRTAGAAYAEEGIHMCAVDTGWITDERAHAQKMHERDKGFRPPLDVVDGASRVCHPIISGLNGSPFSGVFVKDYEVAPW